jgi:hypothetical protein
MDITDKSGGSGSLLHSGVGALSRPRSISNRMASRRAGPSGEERPDERISRRSIESPSLCTAFAEELSREDEEESSRDGSLGPLWALAASRANGKADTLISSFGPMSVVCGLGVRCPLWRPGSSASEDHSIPSLSPLPTSSSQAAPTSSQFLSWRPWASGWSFLTRPGSIEGAGSIHREFQTIDEKNVCDFKAVGSLRLP